MTTFALVHGAWHGGWAFDALSAELEARGHRAVAPDLPCDDPEADASRYAAAVCEALDRAQAGDDVVAVGHSLGGLTIPLVAAARPVRHMLWLCALVPIPGRSMSERWDEPDLFPPGPAERIGRNAAGLSYWPDPADAIEAMYADCDPDLAGRAVDRLRPQASAPGREVCPLAGWPDVPSTYLVCAEDLMIGPAWSRRAARNLLGVTTLEWPGSHSPMLARPAELADLLASV